MHKWWQARGKARRVSCVGSKPKHPVWEKKVLDWVKDRHKKGRLHDDAL